MTRIHGWLRHCSVLSAITSVWGSRLTHIVADGPTPKRYLGIRRCFKHRNSTTISMVSKQHGHALGDSSWLRVRSEEHKNTFHFISYYSVYVIIVGWCIPTFYACPDTRYIPWYHQKFRSLSALGRFHFLHRTHCIVKVRQRPFQLLSCIRHHFSLPRNQDTHQELDMCLGSESGHVKGGSIGS